MRNSPNPFKEAQRAEIERLMAEYLERGGKITVVDSSAYNREGVKLSNAQMTRRRYLMQESKN